MCLVFAPRLAVVGHHIHRVDCVSRQRVQETGLRVCVCVCVCVMCSGSFRCGSVLLSQRRGASYIHSLTYLLTRRPVLARLGFFLDFGNPGERSIEGVWACGRMKLPGFGSRRDTKRHRNNSSHNIYTVSQKNKTPNSCP